MFRSKYAIVFGECGKQFLTEYNLNSLKRVRYFAMIHVQFSKKKLKPLSIEFLLDGVSKPFMLLKIALFYIGFLV